MRSDHVISLCEVKYSTEPLGTAVISEFEKKMGAAEFPKDVSIEKILIVNKTPSPALIESEYFHHIITADQLIQFEY